VNLRLLAEYKKQKAWRAKCRRGGIESGKSRASSTNKESVSGKGYLKGSSTTNERVVQAKPNSSSSVFPLQSSIPSSKKNLREEKLLLKTEVLRDGVLSEFEVFWESYPRKIGKKKALAAWRKAKDRPFTTVILAALEKAKQSANLFRILRLGLPKVDGTMSRVWPALARSRFAKAL
jgi:hypothetical protein